MNDPANHTTVSKPQRTVARLLVFLLIASTLVAASWPSVRAQDATPDDAAQAEVPVSDEPAVTDVTDVPAAPEVEDVPDEPEPPTPTPAPTVVPFNTDYLQAVSNPPSDPVAPGSSIEFDFAYQVTTPRGSTTIVAEIGGGSGENGVWTVQLNGGGAWSEAGSRVQITDAQFTGGGSKIPLAVIVTAPQNVVADETITIWLSSSVARFDGGVEQGVVATQPLVSVRVVPPSPTPTPTVAPIIEPTLDCAGPLDRDVQIGGKLGLTCQITIRDDRAGALVALEPSSGWSVSSGDGASSGTLQLGPFALGDTTPIDYNVPITVVAPASNGATGTLTIRLIANTDAQTELDSITVHLTTVIPDDWELRCSAGSTPVIPGTSADISCTVPDAAWARRGGQTSFSISTADGPVSDTGNINAAVFSFAVPIPCTVTTDTARLSVDADLGNGIHFAAPVSLSIDHSASALVPVLSHSGIDFGDVQWLGTSYAPVETTVTLTVSGASSPCMTADWSIQLITSTFSNGRFDVDPAISFSTLESTGAAVSPRADGAVVPGATATVVSGTGNGVVVVRLMLSMPATVGAGTFSGDVAFSISTGP